MSNADPRPPFGERLKTKIVVAGNRGVGWIQRRFRPPSLPVAADGEIRLHVGCGRIDAPGYINVDLLDAPHIHLQRPLDDLSVFEDASVDLVYACHCLEHFGYRHTRAVLQEWVRVLRPGGVLRLAVPDFAVLAALYASGTPLHDVQGYLLGGQDYRLNFHTAVFDRALLTQHMTAVGLADVETWEPSKVDHHAFVDDSSAVIHTAGKEVPLSLNLQGRKTS
jgi:predicted SAM-dependent methyltransferase